MSLRDLELQVIAAAERVVQLAEAERAAALESCRDSAATARTAPVQAEVLAAHRVLERSVIALRRARRAS